MGPVYEDQETFEKRHDCVIMLSVIGSLLGIISVLLSASDVRAAAVGLTIGAFLCYGSGVVVFVRKKPASPWLIRMLSL